MYSADMFRLSRTPISCASRCMPSQRVCHEGEFEQLLGELALHHLDLVLAGQPAAAHPTLRLTSERLASAPVDWHGPAALVRAAAARDFPACLERLPVLLPTAHSPLRAAIDRWFESQGLRPHVAGEFEDSALLAVFAARGLGVFPSSRLGADDIALVRGLRLLGRCDDSVREEVHAIRARRRQHHPLVQRIVAAAR
jgi:LysR family transcriptional activator of nhaA